MKMTKIKVGKRLKRSKRSLLESIEATVLANNVKIAQVISIADGLNQQLVLMGNVLKGIVDVMEKGGASASPTKDGEKDVS